MNIRAQLPSAALEQRLIYTLSYLFKRRVLVTVRADEFAQLRREMKPLFPQTVTVKL